MMATLQQLRETSGRRPFTIVQLFLDKCANVYGSSPCTAAVGVTGVRKCYNTFKTCQDSEHFIAAEQVLTFCSSAQRAALGDSVPGFEQLNAIPCLNDVAFTSTKIDRKNGLAQRATVTVRLMDTEHNDSGVDPYLSGRSYAPQGTFFAKLLARNPYYYQRKMLIYTGYLQPDGSVSTDDMQTSTYYLDKFDGPDANGNVTVTGKDVLTFIDSDKAQLPVATKLTLSAPISDSAVSFTLNCEDSTTDISALTGYFQIESELIEYDVTGTTSTTITVNAVRASLGSVAATHDVDTKAQECYIIGLVGGDTKRADEAMYDLLIDGGVPSANIDLAGFTAEGDAWGTSLDVFGVVTAPTSVKDIISDLAQQVGAYIWNDVRESKVKFRLNRPALGNEIHDAGNDYQIVEQTISVKVDDAERISAVWYFFDVIDHTRDLDKPENYRRVYVFDDLPSSDPDGFQYRTERIKKIFGAFLPAISSSAVVTIASRLQRLYATPLTTISFQMDAKDANRWVGDTLRVKSRMFVDDTGAPDYKIALITEAKEMAYGTKIQVICQVSQGNGRYAVFMPDGSPVYTAASVDQKDNGGYFSSNPPNPQMSNGDKPYLFS